MKRIFGAAGLLLLAIAGTLLYWRLGYNIGLPLLLFVISLAIVGKGNRLIWSAVFPFLCAALAAVVYAAYSLLPKEPEMPKLLFVLVLLSVVPGLILWAAVILKRLRSNAEGVVNV